VPVELTGDHRTKKRTHLSHFATLAPLGVPY
jgi:hypothetical protein